MKLFNRMTGAGWVLIVAGALVVGGCGSDDEEDTTAALTGGGEEAGDEAAGEEAGDEAGDEAGGETTIELPTECGEDGGVVCPAPIESATEVTVEQIAEGAPEAFTGGDVPAGNYELTKVVLYPGSMTANQSKLPVDITVKNNGSFGSAVFDGDAWGIQANLDVEIDALGNVVPLQEALQGGGCFAVEGVTLAGDVTQCSEESDEEGGFELPNSFDYNNDGATVQMLLKFPVDALLAGLEDNPSIAGVLAAVLVNDLQVVLEMEAVE